MGNWKNVRAYRRPPLEHLFVESDVSVNISQKLGVGASVDKYTIKCTRAEDLTANPSSPLLYSRSSLYDLTFPLHNIPKGVLETRKVREK